MSAPSEQSNALALDSLLAFAPIGLAFFDADGCCIRINDYLAHINNLPSEDHTGRHITELYPNAGPILEEKIMQVFSSGEPGPLFELPITSSQQPGRQTASICLFPVTNDQNRVNEVGAAIFLHQTRISEGHLQTPHELAFRHLAETLPQIVWTSDPEGNIDYLSPQWEEISGISPNSPDYADIGARIHEQDREAVENAWKTAVADGEVYDQTYRLANKEGEYRHHTARAVPVRDADGNISKWYGTTTDVEDQKKIELSYKQATESKDMFIAVLGHELRNPLAAISTHYEVLNHPKVTEEKRQKSLKQLGEQIKHLSRLVDDTLDTSRLTSGKLRMEKRPVELLQLTEVAMDGCSIRAREADLTLTLEKEDQPVWIDADPVRISQCINNLLSNSIKFTDPGGRIFISVQAIENGRSVQIKVQDSGIGMNPDEISSLFKPFEQSDHTGNRSKGGLGLGLAVVTKIVELHDGRIHAHSDGVGLGTSFEMEFPTIDPPSDLNAPPKDTDNNSISSTAHILLVDDDPSVADSLRLFFELEGHEVTVASCVNTGLKAFEHRKPDIVFCDISLKEDQDGWEFASKLNQAHSPEALPYLVALSGHHQKEHRDKSLAAGFHQHLPKPPVPEQLRRCISKACFRRK